LKLLWASSGIDYYIKSPPLLEYSDHRRSQFSTYLWIRTKVVFGWIPDLAIALFGKVQAKESPGMFFGADSGNHGVFIMKQNRDWNDTAYRKEICVYLRWKDARYLARCFMDPTNRLRRLSIGPRQAEIDADMATETYDAWTSAVSPT
jgi:hypothetical protein